jgi:predicted ATPase/transcriptional regulator with XRE-family HTH domain
MNACEVPSFGQLLKSLRVEAGLTQEALAERAGLSVRGIQDLERGVTRPLRDTARRLAGGLQLGGAARVRFEQAAGPAPRRRGHGDAPAADNSGESPRDGPPSTLPLQLTRLIGREYELARIVAMIAQPEGRLFTLTGPGGIGKTRLAVEAASRLLDSFPDGVIFVGLAAVEDSALVPAAIARALGVREATGRSILEGVAAFLQARQVLLVLDNVEHLPDAALTVHELLATCRRLSVLATSRAALHLRGEQVVPIAPLRLPPASTELSELEIRDTPAVALFTDRACAVDPDFAITAANAQDVVAICRRLDGLPLAIELAAARCKYLSPQALLARLARSLPLLTGGARDLPERQQTLRATIAWSHDLLPAEAQRVFRCLAIFSGGCEINDAAAIIGTDSTDAGDMFGHIGTLVAASLLSPVERPDGEPRFSMLETIREYGLEMLTAHDQLATIQERHGMHFLALVEEAEPHLVGPNVGVWLDRLELEHDNLRSALSWAVAAGNAAIALRIAGALWRFWYLRSHLTEGRRRLETVLTMPGATAVPPPVRANALFGASVQAIEQGDFRSATPLLEEALALYRQAGDRRTIGATLNVLALTARMSGEHSRATALHEESLEMARAIGNRAGVVANLSNLGVIARDTGDYARAADLYAEALAGYRELKNRAGVALSLTNLAEVTQFQGLATEAAALYREAMPLQQQLGNKQGVAECLEGAALIARASGMLEVSALLFGAADAVRRAIGYAVAEPDKARRQRNLDDLRSALNAAADAAEQGITPFDRAWATGARLPIESAIAEAMKVTALTTAQAATSLPQ